MSNTCRNSNQKCIKSRRYRERMKTELQALRDLLPRMSCNNSNEEFETTEDNERKMDAQTVVKVALSYLKAKSLTQSLLGHVGAFVPEACESIFQDCFTDGLLFLLSDSLVIQFVMGDLQRLLGLNVCELLQTDLRKSLHCEDARNLHNALLAQPTGSFTCSLRFLTMKTSSSFTPLWCSLRCLSFSSQQQVRYVLVCESDVHQRMDAGNAAGSTVGQQTSLTDYSLQSFWTEHTLSLCTTRNDQSLDRLLGVQNALQNKSLYSLVTPAYLENLANLHRDVISNSNNTKRFDTTNPAKRARRSDEDDSVQIDSLVDLELQFTVPGYHGQPQLVTMRLKSRASLANRNKRQKSLIFAHKVLSVHYQQPAYAFPWSCPAEAPSPLQQHVPGAVDLACVGGGWYGDQKPCSPAQSNASGLDSLLPSIHSIWKPEGFCGSPTGKLECSQQLDHLDQFLDFDTIFDYCSA